MYFRERKKNIQTFTGIVKIIQSRFFFWRILFNQKNTFFIFCDSEFSHFND